MLKKIIYGVILVGLAGFLVYGALNRTTAKLSSPGSNAARVNDEFSNGNQGRNATKSLDGIVDLPWVSSDGADTPRSGSGRGNKTNDSRSGSTALSRSVQDWQELSGTVVVANDATLQIRLDGGDDTIQAAKAAWAYAISQGFEIDEGDAVEMWGFYDAEHDYEICCLTNVSSGQSIALRDDSGYPLWAGRGGNARSGRRNL